MRNQETTVEKRSSDFQPSQLQSVYTIFSLHTMTLFSLPKDEHFPSSTEGWRRDSEMSFTALLKREVAVPHCQFHFRYYMTTFLCLIFSSTCHFSLFPFNSMNKFSAPKTLKCNFCGWRPIHIFYYFCRYFVWMVVILYRFTNDTKKFVTNRSDWARRQLLEWKFIVVD